MSLPVWINFMETALKGVPEVVPSAPEGVVNIGGEWFYDEYARGPASAAWASPPPCRASPCPSAARREPSRASRPRCRWGRRCRLRRTAIHRRRRRVPPTTAAASSTCSATEEPPQALKDSASPACALAWRVRFSKNSPWPLVSIQRVPSNL
jgi:hypothetical protein